MTMRIRINVGRIRTGMADKKLTITAMVAQTGISRSSFDRILKDGLCTAFMIGKIAKVLDIPVWELVDK